MKYAAAAISSGSASGQTSRCTFSDEPPHSDSIAAGSPRSESATGCRPRASSRSSAWAAVSSVAAHLEQRRRPYRACGARPAAGWRPRAAAAARRRAGRARRGGARRRPPRSPARARPRARRPGCAARARAARGRRRCAAPRRPPRLGLHPVRVEHGEVAEIGALRVAQAHGEVALQPHLDRALVLGEVAVEPLGEARPSSARGRARTAGRRVVLERLLDPGAVVPAGDDP